MSILGPFRSLTHLAGQAFAATLHGAVHARTARDRAAEARFARAGKDAGARFTERLADTAAAGLAETFGIKDDCDGKCATDECICPAGDEEADESPAAAGLRIFNESVTRMVKIAEESTARTTDLDSIFRSGGQTKETGPRPKLSTPAPRITDSDRLDKIAAFLEDIRKLLQHNSSAASLSPDAADDPTAPTPTPDAAGSPTLGNDPSAVHERRMRQLTDEDRSTTK